MKSNQLKKNLKLKVESFASIKGFCIDALNSPSLVVRDISAPKFKNKQGIATLAHKLEIVLHKNNIQRVVIPSNATKYPALIKILSLIHHIGINVCFEPRLSPHQASNLPLTLLRSISKD